MEAAPSVRPAAATGPAATRSVSERLAPWCAAAAGGALYVLAYPGFGLWPLLAVFLVPLWWSLETASGLAGATARGTLFGVVAYVGGHTWMFRLVPVFLDGSWAFGALAWVLYGALFTACFAAYAGAYHALRRRGLACATAAIPTWIVVEWLQPLVFPVYAGSGLIDAVVLAQGAELGGPLLLSAGVAVVNLAAFERVRHATGRRGPPRAVLITTGAVLVAAIGFGGLRLVQLGSQASGDEASGAELTVDSSVEKLRVGLVQANLGLLEKRTAVERGHRQHLEQSRALLAEGPLDLLVWPETAYARALRGPLPVAGQLVRAGLDDVPLLFGGMLLEDRGEGPEQSNAALLVGHDGFVRHGYRKNLLIPLAEHLPFVDHVPGLAARLPRAQRFFAARDQPALELDEHRIAVPICYEAIRPAFVRRMMRASQPHLLVTLANDAWFGDSREPLMHLQLTRLRAIEHRRHLVRATNSGISALIDPLGRVTARTGLLERASLRGEVAWREGQTLYGRLGDWPGPVALTWIAVAGVGRWAAGRSVRS